MQCTLDRIGEGRMKVVNHFGEAIRRLLIASIIEEEDLDVPTLHWEAFHLRRLIDVTLLRDKLHVALEL